MGLAPEEAGHLGLLVQDGQAPGDGDNARGTCEREMPDLPNGEDRMTHSPSPWRRAGKNSGHIWAPDGDGIVQVAIVGAYSDKETLPFNRERWDADARLISAAPEMLEALEAIMNVEGTESVDELRMASIRARAVIAKARGTT